MLKLKQRVMKCLSCGSEVLFQVVKPPWNPEENFDQLNTTDANYFCPVCSSAEPSKEVSDAVQP